MRLVLFTGKGGVGKTTTSAAAAACAAHRGRRTLVASADLAHSLGDVLEVPLGPEPTTLAPNLDALEIDARVETGRHWGRIHHYLVSMFRHQGIETSVAEELAVLPGAEELVALLAVEAYAQSGAYDLLVLDCAPTGSALRLATLPDVARGMVRVALPVMRALAGAAVPIAKHLVSAPLPDAGVFREAEELLYGRLAALHARITGPETSVRLVVTPERMVIDEARRAYTDLALFEVSCDAVVMNRLLPARAAEEDFFREWCRVQEERRREVELAFAPLPVLTAPLREDEVTGVERLRRHGEELFAEVEPDAVLHDGPRIAFERVEGAGYRATLALPGADPESLDVAKVEGDLVLATGGRRRSIALPRRLASLSLVAARLEGGSLHVDFAPEPAPGETG